MLVVLQSNEIQQHHVAYSGAVGSQEQPG